MSCHDPPLEEKDIPNGLWLCHTCTMKEKIAKEKEEARQAAVQSGVVPNEAEKFPVEAKVEPQDSGIAIETVLQEENERKEEEVGETVTESDVKELENVVPSTDTEPIEVDEEVVQPDDVPAVEIREIETVVQESEKEEELTPFEELIRVASLLNPKQFDLPVDMTEPFPFPGTERVEQIKNGRRVKNKRLIELDVHGCVPLPAKLCYACSKSCKKAPLISCDYCTLFFHQDCLDPPMTALPAGRWMCPNHPQHFIVSLNYP